MRYRCFWCETQIDHGSRKYSISGSLILRVFLVANSVRRIDLGDSICGARRRRYDQWRLAMQNDFDHLDVPIGGKDLHENQDPIVRFSAWYYSKICVFSIS